MRTILTRLKLAAIVAVVIVAVVCPSAMSAPESGLKPAGTNGDVQNSGRMPAGTKSAMICEALSGEVSESDLALDLESRFGITVQKSSSKQFKGVITKIRAGTLAAYSGLQAGDRVLTAEVKNDQLNITVDRNGKTYGAQLKARKPIPAPPPTLSGGTRGLELTEHEKKPPAPEEKKRLIADHDVVIIIDQSGSMGTLDCPDGSSRWEWCEKQTQKFMRDLEGYLKTVTIFTFNNEYHEFHNAEMHKIAKIYHDESPGGMTWTSGPLKQSLDEYFAARTAGGAVKPLLIAVITDGEPNLPRGPAYAEAEVKRIITDAVAKMNNPDEITITFLQIGGGFEGSDFLFALAKDPTMRYRIVDTKKFEEVIKLGLMDSIAAAITSPHENVTAKTNIELQTELTNLSREHDMLKSQVEKQNEPSPSAK
jgi:hypothetical protein